MAGQLKIFRTLLELKTAACLCLAAVLIFSDPGIAPAAAGKSKKSKSLDAVTAATQYAESRVALVKAGEPGPLQADTSGPYGLGEIGRMVSEAVAITGLPRIWTGSSVRNLVILADISHPVWDSGINTNPHMAAALVRQLYMADSTLSITIACAPEYWASPGVPDAPEDLAADGFAAAGYSRMVESLAAELPGLSLGLADLNLDSTRACVSYKEVSGQCDRVFEVASLLSRADYLVLLPKLKTGPLGIDCSLGVLRLALPGPVNGWPRFSSVEPRFLDETLVSLLGSVMVDYVLVDAIDCLEGAGTPDESVRAVGGVVAGEDPVAVDAVAAMLAGFDPLDMEYLDLAGELSLGVADRERIEVLGEVGLEEGRVPLARPRRLFSDETLAAPEFPYQGQGMRRLLYGFSSGPQGDGQEEVHLPFPGMEGWVAAERSPDEPLGPGDAGSGEGAWYGFTYYWSARESAAELWVGSRVPLKVLLNGATVLERTRAQIDSEGGFRVPNQTVDIELPAGGGTLEVYGEYEDSGDRDRLFSLHLARRDEERKYAGSRVPGLVYFLDPAGDQSRSGVVGTAAPGHYVQASLWDGTTQTAACGAQGAFVLKELDPGETQLKVYNPYGRVVADSSVYLEEWTTHRVDFQVPAGGPAVTGDYSGDGRLAVNDVIALLLGMRNYPGDTYYDFNGDGRLNVSDAVALLLFMRPG